MALQSRLTPLGSPAFSFDLLDTSGRLRLLSDYDQSPVLVVAFVCNHCPYVRHIEDDLGVVAEQSPATFVGICSNDAESYPDDAPDRLTEQAARAGWKFDYLVDKDQSVARGYGAVCTPDFFAYGPDRLLAYRGAFDGSTPRNGEPVNGALIQDAVQRIASGEAVPEPHRPSMGCGIKWFSGAEPQ